MKILAYERFHKSYRHLPTTIQQKVDKQLKTKNLKELFKKLDS